MHEVLVNRLGGLSLPRKSVVRLTDRPYMTLDVYRGRKTTIQQQEEGIITVLALIRIGLAYYVESVIIPLSLYTVFPLWDPGSDLAILGQSITVCSHLTVCLMIG